jgi:small-conductance mechanosensitive channel
VAHFIKHYIISLVMRLAGKTKGDLDDRVVAELQGPIFNTVVLLGLMLAIAVSAPEMGWLRYTAPVIVSIIILIWIRTALTLATIIITAISRDEERFKKIDVRTEPLLVIGSKLVVLLIGSYILLIIWGINPVGLLASAGIVGIAVGFAAKDTLANLFSGVFILADRPYKLGDYVNLDTGERGKVTHIGIRSTRILTRDDIEVTIPNGVIGNAKVVNESGGPYPKMRVRCDVQCSYDADLEQVCDVLMQIADEEDLVCQYPSPRVRVRGFAESGINIQLMGWINRPEDRGRVTHILYIKIHQAFREAGLEIPYPKRDIAITGWSKDSEA